MFEKDLKTGQEAEIKFCNYLIQQGKKVIRTYGLNKDWDVATYNNNQIETTFEVKNDVLYNSTGNLAIEYAFKGQKSGIRATKAEYMAIYTLTKIFILKTQDLKDWINLNKQFLKTSKGGDEFKSDIVLIRSKDLVNNSWCEIKELE